ncbi:GAF and ANTAR domain-containing protein [Actinoplanes utahensis]|uniref:GAF and ANTAR domain-containing protein n=1 Tax=Actinoplanes utahensis TaxID=1869 RepID=UPI00068AC9AC|nr:GAF and ANTAR domain-containing protein [Actinoplanes utahensis]GIF32572.1 GAF domain-containing protein [Actinoplanes utahensis]
MVPEPADPVVARLCRLCERAASSLSAAGAGLSVFAQDNQFSLLAAADPASERLEELQLVLGEGPCIDAAADRRPALIADLGQVAPTRWPLYADAMRDAGIRAIFAFPLQIGAAQLGVLDLFRAEQGPLSGTELRRAFDLAGEAVTILLDGQEQRGTERTDDVMAGPFELFQAQGMVMIQIGGTLAEAMARIRAHAYAEDCRLIDVAREILAGDLRFDRDQ